MTKLNSFMVKGERCSGTTYLENLIQHNLKVPVFNNQGWKHGYLSLVTLDSLDKNLFNSLVVMIFRNVFDWLRSFYLSPHHLEGSRAGVWEVKTTFSEFIRREVKNFDCEKNERFFDIHPFYMDLPKNVLELRKWKIEHWLNYNKLKKPVYYLRYEDLLENPEKIIKEINDNWFGVDFKFENCNWYKNSKNIEYKPKEYFKISEEDLEYLVENIDWDLEKKIGYSENNCQSIKVHQKTHSSKEEWVY